MKAIIFYVRAYYYYLRMFFLVRKHQRLERRSAKVRSKIANVTTAAMQLYTKGLLEFMKKGSQEPQLPIKEDLLG